MTPLQGRTLFLGINDDQHRSALGPPGRTEVGQGRHAPTYHYNPANGWIPDKH